MKAFYLAILLVAVAGTRLPAQTNLMVGPQPMKSQTVITSNVAVFSNGARQIIYTGHVRVEDSQMTLTCGQLIAEFPAAGQRIDHLVALTNVVMDSIDEKGQTNHATSDRAVYDYSVKDGVTNEIITLSGHARAENAQVILYGEPITYNRQTGSLTATNQTMTIKQSFSSGLVNTNPPAAKTNLPPPNLQVTNPPVSKTNIPPGTILDIDRMTPNHGPPRSK